MKKRKQIPPQAGEPKSLQIGPNVELAPYYNPSSVRAASKRFVLGSALITGRTEIGQNIFDVADRVYRLGMRAAVESSPGGDALLDFLEQEGERLCQIMLAGKANAMPGMSWHPRALVYARKKGNRADRIIQHAAQQLKPGETGEQRIKDAWHLRTAISLHPNVIGIGDGIAKSVIDKVLAHKMMRIDDEGDFIVLALSDPERDVRSDEGYPATAFAAFHCDGGAWCGWIDHVEDCSKFGLAMDRKDLCMEMIESELSTLRVMSHLRQENLSSAAMTMLRQVATDEVALGVSEKEIRLALELVASEVKDHVASDFFIQLHMAECAHQKHISRKVREMQEKLKTATAQSDAARERDKRRHIDQIRAQEKQANGYLMRASRAEAEVGRLSRRVSELEAAVARARSPNDKTESREIVHEGDRHLTSGLPALWDEVFG